MPNISNIPDNCFKKIIELLSWRDQCQLAIVSKTLLNKLKHARTVYLRIAKLYRTRLYGLACDAKAVIAAKRFIEHSGGDSNPVVLQFTNDTEIRFFDMSWKIFSRKYNKYCKTDIAYIYSLIEILHQWSSITDTNIKELLLKAAITSVVVFKQNIDWSGYVYIKKGIPKAMMLSILAHKQVIHAIANNDISKHAEKARLKRFVISHEDVLKKIAF
jgi:hypothetical protein